MENTIDTLLMVLENPIRRQILAKIATEKHYPLQLSKELNVSQQAIMKHMKVLEKHELVVCEQTPSDIGGPPRKCYVPTQNFSIRIDCGPHTFFIGLNDLNGKKHETIDQYHTIEERFRTILDTVASETKRLVRLSRLLKTIERELEAIEKERNDLVALREQVRSDANRLVNNLCEEYDQRKIVHFILDNNGCSKHYISEKLDIRIKMLEDILEELAKQDICLSMGPYQASEQ